MTIIIIFILISAGIFSILSSVLKLSLIHIYLVNMNKIESVENDFTMKSGDVVPIRTRNLNELKKEYYNYIE